jgi:hypothetical protein
MILVPGSAFAPHHQLDLWTDDVPDVLPHLLAGSAQHARVLFRADERNVCIVVQADVVRAPEHEHGMLGGEHQAGDGA